MFKRALISVSNKTNLTEALKPLVNQGMEIVSTGGTSKYLKENGFKVTDVESVTDFPEVLGGRVKTLHPKIHMGLLAVDENSSHEQDLKKYNVKTFDLVICNLYPFSETAARTENMLERIEDIDIGGVTLLRAAAKNFRRITVISDPSDYASLALGKPDESIRRELAVKAFLHTSAYDMQIAQNLTATHDLRYGENPHQKAMWLPLNSSGLHRASVFQGKELSYNNILDLEAAVRLVKQLKKSAAVIVKHNNPCGVAQSSSISDAFSKAFNADSISCFGGIVAVNGKVDKKSAELMTSLFLECVIAPEISLEAQEVFKIKKNLRVLMWPEMLNNSETFEMRSVAGGMLVQELDQVHNNLDQWKVHQPNGNVETFQKIDPAILGDINFGISVVASLKSNAIAVVKNEVTLGLGMGQVNRIDSVKLALSRAEHFHQNYEGAILVGDAFFPFADSLELLSAKKIKIVVQPGGSIKDQEVIKKASELGITMVMTGQRHFRH